MLTGGRPGALERHQTLHTAIESSLRTSAHCPSGELWTRLSVFAGTFSLAAAEEVCAEVELERGNVVNALGLELVDKSVVLSGGVAVTGCSTRCASSAPSDWPRRARRRSARARHVGRYLGKARYFGEHCADDDQMVRYEELRETHSNVRAALEYALGNSVEAAVPTVQAVPAESAVQAG